MTGFLGLALCLLGLPALLSVAYLLACTSLSAALARPPRSARRLRFDVLVPAHDEASIITAVIVSLQDLDWPAERFRIRVVADNCSDGTAALARLAGAEVLERGSTGCRGKGYALAFGFADSALRRWADAVVVVDADTVVERGLLECFAARIEQGAGAVQAHYRVRNAMASWRTRLMTIALACFHQQRSRARERLGLSCGIRGNGWCVTHELLRKVPYAAFSLTEDLEYGIDLGLAGHRVHYADEAAVAAEMVSGALAARSQRQRWEHGRRQLLRMRLWPLLFRQPGALRPLRIDLLLDLLVPPLSGLALQLLLLVLAGAAALHWHLPAGGPCLALGLLGSFALALHVLRGWQLSAVGPRGLLDLLHVPGFIVWKLVLMMRRHDAADWVRTRREEP